MQNRYQRIKAQLKIIADDYQEATKSDVSRFFGIHGESGQKRLVELYVVLNKQNMTADELLIDVFAIAVKGQKQSMLNSSLSVDIIQYVAREIKVVRIVTGQNLLAQMHGIPPDVEKDEAFYGRIAQRLEDLKASNHHKLCQVHPI